MIEKTKDGWIKTEVIKYQIKLVKPLMNVIDWVKAGKRVYLKQPGNDACDRCNSLWYLKPENQMVNLCIMEKMENKVICDTCLAEIDQSEISLLRTSKLKHS